MRYLAVALFGALIGSGAVVAQQAPRDVEVVSFKRSSGEESGRTSVQTTPGGITIATNQSVASLMLRSIQPELPREIENRPDWLSDRYDITLKRAAGQTASADVWRSVLAERFKLQAHIETRERDGFALALARRDGALGPNLQPSTLDCQLNSPAPATVAPAAPAPPREPHWPTRQEAASLCGFSSSPGQGFLVSGGMPMEWLAGTVGGLIGESFMTDQTGLTGIYSVNLDFPATRRSAGATAPDRAEVLTAIQEQLGLTVQRAKVPVSVLVIDHIERPSEN